MGLFDFLKSFVTSERAEIQNNFFSFEHGFVKPSSLSSLKKYIKTMPEVFSRAERIVDDVLSGYEVVCKNKKLKKEVEVFLIKNRFFEELKSSLLDKLFEGDGYLEPVFVSESRVKREAFSFYNTVNSKTLLNLNVEEKVNSVLKKLKESNAKLFEPKKIKRVKASTVWKKVNKHGDVIEFVQKISGREVARWSPDELINLSFFKYESDVYGFTPLFTALDDLVTLDYTKTYVKNFFKNNGVPDFIIGVKNASEKDPRVVALRETMKKRAKERKRGAMIVTGDLFFQSLTEARDMDFKKLYSLIDKLLDYTWGRPPQLNQTEGSATRAIDTYLIPYYNRIRRDQLILEQELNINFFWLFGSKEGEVSIKLKNSYIRDAVRNFSWATGAYHDGVISPSEYREVLGLSSSFPNDIKNNPFYENPKKIVNNPFTGVASDNKVNPDKNDSGGED